MQFAEVNATSLSLEVQLTSTHLCEYLSAPQPSGDLTVCLVNMLKKMLSKDKYYMVQNNRLTEIKIHPSMQCVKLQAALNPLCEVNVK